MVPSQSHAIPYYGADVVVGGRVRDVVLRRPRQLEIGGETITCKVALQIQQNAPASSLRTTPARQMLQTPPLSLSPVEKARQFILACCGLSR